MEIRNRRAIREAAAQSLAAAPGDPRKLALIYTGGTAILALVCPLISYAVGLRMNSSSGGLSNMGMVSILSTVQSVLPLAQSLVVLFLGYGYQSATLRMARRHRTEPADLLEGFRRFGPLLRLWLLKLAICCALAFVATYAGAIIFTITPLSNGLMEVLEPMLTSTSMLTTQLVMDQATLEAVTEAMLPMIPIVCVVFLALGAPLLYQYRMSEYSLLDNPGQGALASLRASRDMMKGRRLDLFKLDLGFWWFYVLEVLTMVLAYGDELLPILNVTLPWSDTVSYFLFYCLSLAAQMGIYYLFLNRVNVTYATAYDALRPQPQEPAGVALGNIFNM